MADKIKMTATKPHSWGMKTVEADEEFEVDNEAQAQTLVSLGRARRSDEKSTKTKATGTKGAAPEEEAEGDENGDEVEETEAETGQPTTGRGKYQQRRMKAKE